jgi:hypothetical protein
MFCSYWLSPRWWADQVAVASSDDIAMRVDQLQYDTGEGPCITALTETVTCRSDDIAARAAGRTSDRQRTP